MTLQLNNIGRCIRSSWLVRRLSFSVADGECLALVGPSGCGKSTTLRLIAGLDKPDEGRIWIDGKDVTGQTAADRRVGMVFQSYALFPHLTVAGNLDIGLRIRGVSHTERRERISAVLELMQLGALTNRRPAQLSGGQRQRVALARALLRDPQVFLLDEPMSNLDTQLSDELRPGLRRVIREGRRPAVYVTHDQHEAMAIASHIGVMRHGYLEQLGTPSELYCHPLNTFVASFIGRPQINLLPPNGGVVVGIRPEHIRLCHSGGLRCHLIQREWLGASQLWYLESSRGPLRLVCDGHIPVPETLYVEWKSKDEHHFEPIEGQRLP
ncbi:ABC transporter ATP-binding protein [cyanobiont of Ornithocercus magnificus]|nr:ABC transporter ATP-binding protein [cyanobiont of Ornithocercus magnificus]